jgi:hypothetical protein
MHMALLRYVVDHAPHGGPRAEGSHARLWRHEGSGIGDQRWHVNFGNPRPGTGPFMFYTEVNVALYAWATRKQEIRTGIFILI